MRAGALFSSNGISRFVRRNGPEDVGRESQLDAIGRDPPLAKQRACVVDEHIQARGLLTEALGKSPHRFEVTEVAELDLNIAAGRPGDQLLARTLAAFLVAGEQPNGGTETRKALGRGEAEPGAGAGHEHELPFHGLEVGGVP